MLGLPYTDAGLPANRLGTSHGQSVSNSSTITSASPVPTERLTIQGIEVIPPSAGLSQNYPQMSQARIYHPKQAPSAVSSENFLLARAALNPGHVHNMAQSNIARISNLYKETPRFRNDIDILA